jgi:hypothetical protein
MTIIDLDAPRWHGEDLGQVAEHGHVTDRQHVSQVIQPASRRSPGSSALERYADELAAIEVVYSQAARKSAGYAALRPGESAAAEAGK